MWWHNPWDGPWWGFPWMWIFPLLFLIVFIVFLFRGPACSIFGTHRSRDGEENARQILDRRYARGEISREDYQRMRKDLELIRK